MGISNLRYRSFVVLEEHTLKKDPGGPRWYKSTLAVDRRRARIPKLIKVTDRMYSAVGYAISNVIYVLSDKSVIVIDTTESTAAAAASLADFRKFCQLPIRYIIYTHFHGDHISGASAFWTPSTIVIAQKGILAEIKKNDLLLPYRKRMTRHQFGFKRVLWRGPESRNRHPEFGYVSPDIVFDEEYRFEEGRVRFELYHTMGETLDHLMVWLPDEQVLLPGDLFYRSFPMLSNPMRPDRPVLEWAESLERMRALQARHLIPSHGTPISGAEEIDLTLANYGKAIRHIHDETVNLINSGLGLEEILHRVRLPKYLAELPYLQEHYGKVDWAIRGIFRQYTGWYSFDPKELKPSPRAILDNALIEACGGVEALIARARKALADDQPQLALELVDIVIAARPGSRRAHSVRVKALSRLIAAATNGVERNIYKTALRRAQRNGNN